MNIYLQKWLSQKEKLVSFTHKLKDLTVKQQQFCTNIYTTCTKTAPSTNCYLNV